MSDQPTLKSPVQCSEDIQYGGGDSDRPVTGQGVEADGSSSTANQHNIQSLPAARNPPSQPAGTSPVRDNPVPPQCNPPSLRTDAEADRRSCADQGASNVTLNRAIDVIQMTSTSGTSIVAHNLAGAMKPNTVLQIADTIHNTKTKTSQPLSSGEVASHPVGNRYPLTDSKNEPLFQHLDVVSSRLDSTDWRRLGRRLNLQDSVLNHISTDYQTQGQYEISYQMLARWKRVSLQPTLQTLALALVEIGRGDLADELR